MAATRMNARRLKDKSLKDLQIADDASITLSKLNRGADLLLKDTSTGELNMNAKKIYGIADASADADVPSWKQVKDKISADVNTAATSAVIYKGTWDASGGTMPTSPQTGYYYRITVAGTVPIQGVNELVNVKDSIIYNGTNWDLIDNTEGNTASNGVKIVGLDIQIKTQNGSGIKIDANGVYASRIYGYVPTETPTGTLDTFTIPENGTNIVVYVQGLRMKIGAGADYTLTDAATIVFTTDAIPASDEWIEIDYTPAV